MTTSQKQHNSPTRGWVACTATKRDCRYGSDQHRTVQISSNLEGHSEAIRKSAADGVIDAQETKDLSKSIADGVFAPKEKSSDKRTWGEIVSSNESKPPISIPQVECDSSIHVEPDYVYDARRQLNYSINGLNNLTSNKSDIIEFNEMKRKAAQKKLDSYYTDENFERMYNNTKTFANSKGTKEQIKESFDLDAHELREASIYYKDQVDNYDTQIAEAENKYLQKKSTYGKAIAKEREDKVKIVDLDITSQDYFETKHAIGGKLNITEYNSMIDKLKKDTDMPLEDKIKGVHGLRAELIETAKVNYRSAKRSPFVEKIGDLFSRYKDRRSDEIKDAENKAIDLNHAEDGIKLAKFSQNLKKAPWDFTIRDHLMVLRSR